MCYSISSTLLEQTNAYFIVDETLWTIRFSIRLMYGIFLAHEQLEEGILALVYYFSTKLPCPSFQKYNS
jgi:hypothetical protein